MGNLDFIAAEHAETAEGGDGGRTFEPLPAGDYKCQIIESEIRQTKAGTGSYLSLTHEITSGPHTGRRVWARLTMSNPNPTAERIGKMQLSALCGVLGIEQLADSAELHDRVFVAKITRRRRTDTDEVVNDVGSWSRSMTAPPASPTKGLTPDDLPF